MTLTVAVSACRRRGATLSGPFADRCAVRAAASFAFKTPFRARIVMSAAAKRGRTRGSNPARSAAGNARPLAYRGTGLVAECGGAGVHRPPERRTALSSVHGPTGVPFVR
jgi:hypothetical protein